jgi:hypothetical protein
MVLWEDVNCCEATAVLGQSEGLLVSPKPAAQGGLLLSRLSERGPVANGAKRQPPRATSLRAIQSLGGCRFATDAAWPRKGGWRTVRRFACCGKAGVGGIAGLA